MDEVFGENNRCNIITIKRGSATGHKAINAGVINTTEYVISYAKEKTLWKPNRLFKRRARNERYNNFILNRNEPLDRWKFCSLLDAFADKLGVPKNKVKKSMGTKFEKEIFEFIKKNATAVIQYAYPDEDKVSKEVSEAIKKSKSNAGRVFLIERMNEPDIYLLGGQRLLFYSDRLREIDGEIVTVEPLSDIWDDVLPNDLHNEGGVKLKKGKKPEKLISRIIELNSNAGDLFLDFHIGSGTSCAVAHKMGRQYIGIEQLEYGDNDSVTRLQNVIGKRTKKKGMLIDDLECDNSGISKIVDWHGGGDFVYCEVMKYNENFMDKIQKAKTSKELEQLWKGIGENSFLNWYVNAEMPQDAVKDFREIGKTENGLEKQKRLLAELLNKNQVYVNLSEINDTDFKVSETDKKLNREFYGEGV